MNPRSNSPVEIQQQAALPATTTVATAEAEAEGYARTAEPVAAAIVTGGVRVRFVVRRTIAVVGRRVVAPDVYPAAIPMPAITHTVSH